MHILVTGGLGFLGNAVTLDLIATGHKVTVLSRGRTDIHPVAGATLVKGDVRDRQRMRELVAGNDFDGVVHLAALTRGRDSIADPLTYFDVNAGGTLNVLMALDSVRETRPPARFIFASTNIVYGSVHVGALSEDLSPHPESPYAASKVAAEQLIAGYATTGAIGAVILRCFNIAGAVGGVTDTDPARIIPNVFRAVVGEIPRVALNGDGSAIRDFVHVVDVASAFRLALEAATPGKHAIYNIGSGIGTSMAEVITTAEKVLGVSVPVINMPPKPEPHTLTAAITNAQRDLNWTPENSALSSIVSDVQATWLGLGR